MRCPTCSATVPAEARFCPACGATLPEPGAPRPVNPLDVIPPMEGIPRPVAEPTRVYVEDRPPSGLRRSDWTYPLQLSATAWLATAAVIAVLTAFQEEDGLRQAVYPAEAVRRLQTTDADALGFTQLVFDAFIFTVLVWALFRLFVAFHTYRRPSRWTFFVVLALTAVDSMLVLVSLVFLVGDIGSGRPLGHTLVTLVVRLAAAGLCGWMVVALRRYGRPWALVAATAESGGGAEAAG